jgi:tetratricopeptide (TPR) repeat protein
MDSDDTISEENGRKLRDLSHSPVDQVPTAYVMQVHCPGPPDSTDCTVVDHVKMFRNDPRLRFEGRIHEQILPAIRRIDGAIQWTEIYVTHSGSEHSPEAKKRKQQRDLRLLEMERAEQPEHPFVLFNLGMTYADMDQSQQAVEYLKRCLIASTPEESHVRKAYALLVGCLVAMDKDEEAWPILGRGRELFPEDAELLFRQGILEQRAKNYEQAIESYLGALNNRGERHFSSRDSGITGYKARHNMASIYREMGRPELAELQWRLSLVERPSYQDGWRGLVDTLLDQNKHVTLDVEIETAKEREDLADEITGAAARLAAKRGNIETALRMLDQALEEASHHVELLRLKCQLAFEHATAEVAVAALEELCRRTPDDGAAWHNLGTAYHRSGCNALAEISYQKSLALRPDSVSTVVQLGCVHEALGRHDAARRAREAASRIGTKHPAVEEAPSAMAGRPMSVVAG